ncbi:MAG: hypothetical protein J5636_01640 [Clostridiales bacterium]|nr:hypothetical protein [Clostridiales bacterium]
MIVRSADNLELPDSLLLWAYEATLCSNCREGIIEAMLERGIMSDSIKEESKWDANLDIRKMFEVESE